MTGPAVCPLDARELRALTMVSEGATNQRIADELGLSPHTVKSMVNRMLTKVGVRNRAAMVGTAMRNGWVR